MLIKNYLSAALAAALGACLFFSCAAKKESVLVLSCNEEFRNEAVVQMLRDKFPQYDVTVQYMSTGNTGAKLKAEGVKTDTDIVIDLESSYLIQNKAILADVSSWGSAAFLPQLLPADGTYLPWSRESGCIAIREDILAKKGLRPPESYADLLKPEYKGLISMPSPKASGTGYTFLLSLVKAWGEDEAFAYFDKLADNILQFTTSGSGPVNALVQGEAAIALGIAFQAVDQINKGVPITIRYFAEGAPNTVCGMAIIKGKEKRESVREVFSYIAEAVVRNDNEKFAPEQIFRQHANKIPNYPQNIPYADLSAADPLALKEQLLAKWNH